ncbi:DUF2182 domain-containing protein [Pseudooctadecabacter sp.]|uniref:DUF2182 domain-containing protein n=1 Tax=Pseudooctadecabacter sp. TaxID=1966338 RepID=UPI0035C7CB63
MGAIFNIRSVLWVAFFALILLAWSVMYMMAVMSGVDLSGRPVGMNMMSMVTFGALFPMWAIMMAAMMLPTLVPTLRACEDLMVSANGTRTGWAGILLGYFVVWGAFAGLISVVQVGLIALGAVDALGIASSAIFAGALLVIVGLFRFSRAKEVCHGVCHSPMMYFLGHWKTGFAGGLRMGLYGACFVGGVISLLWMGLATLFMTLEKLPSVGHIVTKPAGVVLIAAGLILPVWANL